MQIYLAYQPAHGSFGANRYALRTMGENRYAAPTDGKYPPAYLGLIAYGGFGLEGWSSGKYGFYVKYNNDTDQSSSIISAYGGSGDETAVSIRGCKNGVSPAFAIPGSGFASGEEPTDACPVSLYRLVEAGTVSGNDYTLADDSADVDFGSLPALSTENTVIAQTATDVTGISDALTPQAVEDIAALTNGGEITVNADMTVTDYTSGSSVTYSVTSVYATTAGETGTIENSSFDGTPMTVRLYTGGIEPRQVVHIRHDGTKEYFYNLYEDVPAGAKTYQPEYGESGDMYVTIQITDFSDVRILSTPEPQIPEQPELPFGTEYYGYGKLSGDVVLRNAYKAIYHGVAAKSASIELSAYALTQEQLKKVFELYRFDHPEHYWLPNGYSMTSSDGKISALELTYLTGFDDTAFETAAAELLKAADGKTTDYDKALLTPFGIKDCFCFGTK